MITSRSLVCGSKEKIKSQDNVSQFIALCDSYFLPKPTILVGEFDNTHVFWEQKYFISRDFGKDGYSHTKVDITFGEDITVLVMSDNYLNTKIKDLGNKYTCKFNSVQMLMILILQLKDLGFIR